MLKTFYICTTISGSCFSEMGSAFTESIKEKKEKGLVLKKAKFIFVVR